MPEKIGSNVLGTATAIIPDKTVYHGVKGIYIGTVKDVKDIVNLAKRLSSKKKVTAGDIVYGILPDKLVAYTVVGTGEGMVKDGEEFKKILREVKAE